MDPVAWGVVCIVESSLWAGKDSVTAIPACEGGECFSRGADSFDPFIAIPVMLVLVVVVVLLLLLLLLHHPNCICRFCSI